MKFPEKNPQNPLSQNVLFIILRKPRSKRSYTFIGNVLILRRTKLVKRHFKNILNDEKRIGPCLIFNLKKYNKFKKLLEIKNFDFSQIAFKEEYDKCLILPIHFGIPEKVFSLKLKKLLKVQKSKLLNKN